MSKQYLDIKPEDLEKISRRRSEDEKLKIEPEHLFIAEFGKHYGWAGVIAILDNEIDGHTASWLLQAARKVDARYSYDRAKSVLIGSASAQSKKPSQTFKKAMSDTVKEMSMSNG